MRQLLRVSGLAATVVPAVILARPAAVAAHGTFPDAPPTLLSLATGWSIQPLVVALLAVAAVGWLLIVRRIDRAHPDNPVPGIRTAAFLGALATIAVALLSGVERYDTTLFSVHMVQHILLMLVAAPLLALSAPITQLLRVASPAVRQRWILPVLRARVVVALSHPVVASVAFAAVLWGTHFSPLFDAALETPAIHDLEHGLYLGAALLFWWPAIGADPSPHRMSHPVRGLYVLIQMPVNSFLGMALVFASEPLYPHYVSLGSPYGITALADQQLAGGIMWLAGDVILIASVLGIVAAWMRHEERDAPGAERRAAADRQRIDELAERHARERAGSGGAAGRPD